MKRILLAGVVSVAFVGPVWAGCDPPGGGYGSCPPPTPAPQPVTSTSSASAASHATAGASASVSNVNRSNLSNSNTNRVTIRNVINTPASTGSSPPLTVAPPIAPAAAAPVAPSTPAATTPADPPADPATHPHTGHGHGGGAGYAGYTVNNNYSTPQEPVATAYAPSFGTVNPCVGTSASLGAQFQLFGLSAGGQSMDEECRMLRLGTQADVIAARNLICLQSSQAAQAYYEAGLPCPADRAKYAAAQPQPIVQQAPAPTRRANAPAWCARAMQANPGTSYAQCE